MISKQNTKLFLLRKSTIKTRFTTRFLISLSKIKRVGPIQSGSTEEKLRRTSHRIQIAAYSSMAHAVGPRRVWSRALLLKLKNRARTRRFLRNRVAVSEKTRKEMKKKNVISREMNKANMLRKLVPGGNRMDICGLLEETAHYIKCLATQFKVMQNIVDQCSIQG